MQPFGRLALLAALSAGAAGCGTLEIDAYPLFRSGPVDNDGGWAWEALGPLVYGRTDPRAGDGGRRQWGVRPLFGLTRRRSAGGERWTAEVLWPLGRFHRAGPAWNHRLVPFYWSWGVDAPDGARSSVFVFPFLFRRQGPPGDGWALFPFYGHLRKFFGMDELTFVLFPLYAATESRLGRSHHLLWPFLGWGGGDRGWWFRAFPFVARHVETGRLDRHSYLWPFVSFGTDMKQTGRPRHSFLIWPFYGRWTRDQGSGWTVLFPLFRVAEDRRKGSGERNLPYPFYQTWWSPREEGFRIWPLYGSYTSKPTPAGSFLVSRFYLWPFVWNREYGFLDAREAAFHLVPLFTWRRFSDRDSAGTGWSLWPLVEYVGREDGAGQLAIGVVLPWRRFNDAVLEHWGVFFSPYVRRTWADGRLREQSLLGLYRRYEAPGFSRWTVPVLYARRRSASGTLDQFLLGLVRYETEASGGSRLRLFGVPIPLTRGGGTPGAPPPAKER